MRKKYSELTSEQKQKANKSSYNWKYNTQKGRLVRLRTQATRRGISCTLTEDTLPQVPDLCPILNIKLDGRDMNHTSTIDRIDNTKGYIPGNVQIISYRANMLKRDATIEEMFKLGQWAKNIIDETL